MDNQIMCGVKHNASKKCHWIIVRDDGGAVFDYPLKSEEDALTVMSTNNLKGYHAEHRFNSGKQS
jgi:hypothetical protein